MFDFGNICSIYKYITKSVVFICNIDISTEGYTNSSDIKNKFDFFFVQGFCTNTPIHI